MSTAIQVIEQTVYSVEPLFNEVRTVPTMAFKREAEFAIQVLMGNEYAMAIAAKNPQSVRDAVTNVGSIGLSLNPAEKLAYLVPRKNKICLDVSYMGLMRLATECGAIQWAQCNVVHANDTFELNGFDKPPTHIYNPFSTDEQRGDEIGVYCVVKANNGDYLVHSMSVDEVNAIRDRSESWKAKKSGPWLTDRKEMVKKTCVKQASKYWPRKDGSVNRLDHAIEVLNQAGEGIDFKAEQSASNGVPLIAGNTPIDLPADRLAMLQNVADAITKHVNNDNMIDAYEAYLFVTDSDEKMALWNMIRPVRGQIKKYGETDQGKAQTKEWAESNTQAA